MKDTNTCSLVTLLTQIKQEQQNIAFEQVMQVIKEHYQYKPTLFINGGLVNEIGFNEGSCKIFYFAKLNKLSQQQTLACFGHYYRDDVLADPDGTDHENIRNFIKSGWLEIEFKSVALQVI